MKLCNKKSCSKSKAVNVFPGAAINNADKDRVNEELERERTCTLDSNPNSQKLFNDEK